MDLFLTSKIKYVLRWLKFFESGNYKNGIKIGDWNYLVYDN